MKAILIIKYTFIIDKFKSDYCWLTETNINMNIKAKLVSKPQTKINSQLTRNSLWVEEVVELVTKKSILDFQLNDQIVILRDCSKLYSGFVYEYIKTKYGIEEATEIHLAKYNYIPRRLKHDIYSKLWESQLAFRKFIETSKQ